jgi:hypothetical protein
MDFLKIDKEQDMKKKIYHFGIFICSLRNILIFICLTGFLIIQQTPAEETMSSFLNIDVDARGTAMGGAHGAITEGIYSVYWNPAGLSEVLFKEIGATYQRAFQDINYSFIGYATPSDFYGALAFHIFYLDSGSITSTYENLDGSFAGTGDPFSVTDLGFGLTQRRILLMAQVPKL